MFLGRVVGDGEPQWTTYDRDVAMAWIAYRDSLCDCGVPKDEAWTVEAFREWGGQVRHCGVCGGASRAQEAFMKQKGPNTDVNTHGMKVVPVRKSDLPEEH